MAWLNVSATLGFAGPLNPMWLSLIWANRNVGLYCWTAVADPATCEITSPPATVSTTAAPNQAPCRMS
jgi:hypothetical protein